MGIKERIGDVARPCLSDMVSALTRSFTAGTSVTRHSFAALCFHSYNVWETFLRDDYFLSLGTARFVCALLSSWELGLCSVVSEAFKLGLTHDAPRTSARHA